MLFSRHASGFSTRAVLSRGPTVRVLAFSFQVSGRILTTQDPKRKKELLSMPVRRGSAQAAWVHGAQTFPRPTLQPPGRVLCPVTLSLLPGRHTHHTLCLQVCPWSKLGLASWTRSSPPQCAPAARDLPSPCPPTSHTRTSEAPVAMRRLAGYKPIHAITLTASRSPAHRVFGSAVLTISQCAPHILAGRVSGSRGSPALPRHRAT